MITLKNIVSLLPDFDFSFSPDSPVQVQNFKTGAHYRMGKDCLELSGDPVLCSTEDFFNLPVRQLIVFCSQLHIYIG